MSDTTTDLDKLRKALDAEREERKADRTKHAEFRRAVAVKVGLGDDADSQAIITRLDGSSTEAVVSDRLAPVVAERDQLKARLTEVETRYTEEKVESALREAFTKSGADVRNLPDMLAHARPIFSVDEKGNVRTKADAPNTIPGADPQSWILTELRAKRAHWWPTSVGGGARGGSVGQLPASLPGNTDAFKPGPTWNLTGQMLYAKQFGSEAAARAAKMFGGGR